MREGSKVRCTAPSRDHERFRGQMLSVLMICRREPPLASEVYCDHPDLPRSEMFRPEELTEAIGAPGPERPACSPKGRPRGFVLRAVHGRRRDGR